MKNLQLNLNYNYGYSGYSNKKPDTTEITKLKIIYRRVEC